MKTYPTQTKLTKKDTTDLRVAQCCIEDILDLKGLSRVTRGTLNDAIQYVQRVLDAES